MNEESPITQAENTTDLSLKRRFFSIKTLLSFLLAFIVLYLLYTRVELEKITTVIGKTNWFLFIVAFCIFYLSIFLRGLRWHFLLENLGFHGKKIEVSEILFISWFANVIVPAKLGDLYRSYLMDRNYGFSISKTVGSVFTERVFDMIILFIMFGLTGLLTFGVKLDARIRYLLVSGFIMTFVLISGLFTMKYFGKHIRRFLPSRIRDIYGRFEIGTLESIKNVPLLITYTLLIWMLEAGRLYFVTFSLNLTIPIMLVIFIALTSSLLTALPITPAGLGAVEVAIVGILLVFGIDKNIAVSIAILDRLISYWSVVPLGYITFVMSSKC
jgi:uncharacterized protein (TIRG00374 family)